MIDATTELLGGAGVQLDEVKIRSVAPEREIVREVVREILSCDEPPDAFLCRSDFYARVVSEMLLESKAGERQEQSEYLCCQRQPFASKRRSSVCTCGLKLIAH